MRRGSLYSACQEFGYTKLALGHHLDDAAESFFMNMMNNGTLRAMAPIYKSKYDIHVIRPLIKVRESQLAEFARSNGFAVIGDEACPAMQIPVKMPVARENAKGLLRELEKENKELFKSLSSAFERIQDDTFFDETRFRL